MRALSAGVAALWLWSAAAAAAQPQVTSERPDTVAVTAYRDRPAVTGARARREMDDPRTGLALITETRTIDLPKGPASVSFRGVADGLIPESVAVEGLPDGVLERNYRFDLLSPGSLLERFVGEQVRLVRTHRVSGRVVEETARVRSGPNGVVLELADGLEALSCSGAPERLVFDRVPEGLGASPTLSVTTLSAAAGRRTVRLSYLTTGLEWSADYVARIRPDGRGLDLSGWITLENQGATGFVNAPTQVVAGNLARDREALPETPDPVNVTLRCWPSDRTHTQPRSGRAPAPLAQGGFDEVDGDFYEEGEVESVVVTGSRIRRVVQGDLGDYKLYTLPEPTTVAARQTKQVLFLEQEGVPFERVYTFTLDPDAFTDEDAAVEVTLRMENTAAGGLGKPLPDGTVSVRERDGRGRLVLAGEQLLRDTPVGAPLRLVIGRALDVIVEPRVVAEDDLPNGRVRRVIEAVLLNAKPHAVRLDLRHAGEQGVNPVRRTSHRSRMEDGYPTWTFRLAPGARQVLRYTTLAEN